MDNSRRRFFKNYCLGKTIDLISDVHKSFKRAASDSDYFESYESCYPLISEYAYFMEDEAEELGIETSNKDKREIVEEIFVKRNK
jgi:hypothetical protein